VSSTRYSENGALEIVAQTIAVGTYRVRVHHRLGGVGNPRNLGVVLTVERFSAAKTGGPTATSEDAKLVERAKDGDAAAYERLVRGQQEVAFRTAYLITGDASEAEDATQEAFVKAYRSLGRFRPGAPFRPWLLSIVANEAKNRSKAAGRRARLVLRAAAEAPVRADDASPEAAAVAAERQAELLLALEALREVDRLAIACRYFLGLSEEETAAALGCARGTVKSRLSRAIRRLRETMTEEDDAAG
jgi:RNA polymerase sigma factor (sigma-70 family)